MNKETFKKGLQCPTPIPNKNNNDELKNFIEALKEKYPNCDINLEKIEQKDSTKKDSFISIKVKNIQHPITFRIPVKRTDLSIYQTSPEYDTLNYRYDIYNTIYSDKIIKEFVKERQFLHERFPTVIFNTKIRQKSKFSYEDKIIERMIGNKNLDKSLQKSPYIKDIIGGRHVISSVDGSTEPETLTKMCFEFKQALLEYRKSKAGNNFDVVIQKDYISHPKPNGYQSIHLINESIDNSDCSFETQIRTHDMEEQSKKDEKIAHDTYKLRILDQHASLRVPKYISVTPFSDDNGKPVIHTLSAEDAFYHFYGISLAKYLAELPSVMPVMNDIRDRLHFKKVINKEKEID